MERLPDDLCVILDKETLGERKPETVCREILHGGCRWIQHRDKVSTDPERLRVLRLLREMTGEAGASFFVNDRPDLALLCHADGIHVGQEDLSPSDVRRILGPDVCLGVSTHSTEDLDRVPEEEVEYVSVGPVFATPIKAWRDPVGVALVRLAVRRLGRPIVAIGGMDAGGVSDVIAAGATAVAVVRAAVCAPDVSGAVRELKEALARAREGRVSGDG